jgi:hypothetical protein
MPRPSGSTPGRPPGAAELAPPCPEGPPPPCWNDGLPPGRRHSPRPTGFPEGGGTEGEHTRLHKTSQGPTGTAESMHPADRGRRPERGRQTDRESHRGRVGDIFFGCRKMRAPNAARTRCDPRYVPQNAGRPGHSGDRRGERATRRPRGAETQDPVEPELSGQEAQRTPPRSVGAPQLPANRVPCRDRRDSTCPANRVPPRRRDASEGRRSRSTVATQRWRCTNGP